MKHIFLAASGALFLPSVLNAGTTKQQATKKQKPNIIYILADDLGYGDLGCYGQQKIKTPNIDRLAKEGMLFTQHYAGCTVSAPSRSSLMTGLHTGHTPIRGNKEAKPEGQHPLPASTVTIAKILKGEGYITGAFGKWGLGAPGSEGDPQRQGFDEFYGYNCQMLAHNYYPNHLWHNDKKIILKKNADTKEGEYAQDLIHNHALTFIEENKDKPFFLFMPYVLPHAELKGPDDAIYRQYIDLFPNDERFNGADAGAANYKRGGYGTVERRHASFAAMVSRLDSYVGDVMKAIESAKLEENTLIIFTSDNGPHKEGGADPLFFNSSSGLRGVKRDLYEGGVRVPMIACMKGSIASGSTTDHISAFWDVMPTLASLSGAKQTPKGDGISFLPTLLNKRGQKQHDYLYWEFHEGGGSQAVRMGNWKAVKLKVLRPELTTIELYDLSTDREEQHNIAAQHLNIVAQMERIMRDAHSPSVDFPFLK